MKIEQRPAENDGASDAQGTPTTVVRQAGAGSPAEPIQLLVLETDGLAVYPLSGADTLSIGRADDCQVKLRDPLASRRHATLHLSPLGIEDHESANGTSLGGRALVAGRVAPLQLGQAVVIGNSLLIVRRMGKSEAAANEPRRPRSGSMVAVRPQVIRDPAMVQLYSLIDRLAKGSINLLILGETGVGKEVVAETIHRASPRSAAPLVRINCASLTETLLESELFGHERGAFTGAVSAKPGLIELADGGTVFLDEVGELPSALQAKLLRVVEAREVTRVGGVRARPIDVRFLSATNRSLAAEAARGEFRSDLMFRLNGASIEVPPLRERPSEIAPMAELFLERVAAQMNLSPPPSLSDGALARLRAHSWPGNVRELRNVVERAVLICEDDVIRVGDLALGQELSDEQELEHESEDDSWFPEPLPSSPSSPTSPPLGADSERERIAQALRECGGNQSRAAKILGIPRRTLVRKIALLGLPRPRRSSE